MYSINSNRLVLSILLFMLPRDILAERRHVESSSHWLQFGQSSSLLFQIARFLHAGILGFPGNGSVSGLSVPPVSFYPGDPRSSLPFLRYQSDPVRFPAFPKCFSVYQMVVPFPIQTMVHIRINLPLEWTFQTAVDLPAFSFAASFPPIALPVLLLSAPPHLLRPVIACATSSFSQIRLAGWHNS